MQNQRGFVSAMVLIWIVLGLIVVGGGAYYVMHQQSSSPTLSDNILDNVQTQPSNTIPSNPTSPKNSQTTQGTTNTPPSATIDQNSLVTSSPTPTITGTISGTLNFSIQVGGSQGLSTERGGITVLNGHWSAAFDWFGPGTYPVHVIDNNSGKVLASATLTVKTQTTSNTSAQSITIDQGSLLATSNTAVITGSATGLKQVIIEERDPSLIGTVGDVLDSEPSSVVNGRWSFTVRAPAPGDYYNVVVYSHEITDSALYNKYYSNPQKLTRASSIVGYDAVSGTSKYTDSDFGFWFWAPTSWKVGQVQVQNVSQYIGGTVTKQWSASSGQAVITIQEFYSPNMSIADESGGGPNRTCPAASCDTIRYFFDPTTHTWMQEYPNETGQQHQTGIDIPADVSQNTMGGLHMFAGSARFAEDTIVPLSAHNFLIITANQETNQTYLTKTIAATDPSVATPVSAQEQIATIQAEAAAYGN